jgi:hypothetical protein
MIVEMPGEFTFHGCLTVHTLNHTHTPEVGSCYKCCYCYCFCDSSPCSTSYELLLACRRKEHHREICKGLLHECVDHEAGE